MRVGILTGGGDAPGLNAVIRAFVKTGISQHGMTIVGVRNAFDGLLWTPRGVEPLDMPSCQGLLPRGGTVLGTTNRGDPFAWGPEGATVDRSADVAAAVRELDLAGLVCVGGDGTQKIALRLMRERGVPVIGVPKTIDNDIDATDLTFGFQSAVDIATEALDRLHTTAESHDRVMVLEVMGRDAGHIALVAGIAGGADAILIPEIPYDPRIVADKVLRRREVGRPASVLIVAEGALPMGADGLAVPGHLRKAALKQGRGAGQIAVDVLQPLVDAEMRVTVLGHIQRGGSPVPFDRVLATRFGSAAAGLVAAGAWGEMVRLKGNVVGSVPIAEAIAVNRGVDVDGELVRVARAVGSTFGG
jgi:phosphofructokinase-like protein